MTNVIIKLRISSWKWIFFSISLKIEISKDFLKEFSVQINMFWMSRILKCTPKSPKSMERMTTDNKKNVSQTYINLQFFKREK